MRRFFTMATLIIICVLALHIRSIYAVNASTNSRGNKVGTYIVKFREVTIENVSHFAYLFDIKEDFFEDEASFVFKNKNEQLTVYKHLNQINYKLLRLDNANESVLGSDAEAAKIAVEFFRKKKLPFSYEEALVGFNGMFYKVILVNKLGGINLYAFNNTIIVDIYGNVISADYFYPDFSKYGSCEMLDVRAACEREGANVPEEVFSNGKVNVIYIYADSIIVPGYIIEGRMKDGKLYRGIVNGAVFGSRTDIY